MLEENIAKIGHNKRLGKGEMLTLMRERNENIGKAHKRLDTIKD
ncbi:16286_t:CDS:2 [Cetraspora pellucida]|uniref:16286_t:CDS:1 n=1 Tax=Cetraspora pellucida TaxID=1433469 RepID=A0A9N8VW59_9GLOM|nr:16286_t:CDS:2 [Cetraspora pellucida]